jgi:AraC family transcriptional regulator
MGHMSGYVVFDNRPKLPGVIEVRTKLPGVEIILNHQQPDQGWDVRYCLQSHLLLFRMSPTPAINKFALEDVDANKLNEAGYLNWLPAQTPYRTVTSEGLLKCLCLQFDPDHFDAATGIGRHWDPRTGRDIHNPVLEMELWRLAREMAAPGFASRTLMEGISLAVMADLSRVIKDGEGETLRRPGRLSERQLKSITEYIEGVEEISPTISDLAGLIGVSTRYLTKAFKETTGQTVHSYVANVRIRRAAELLCGTDLPMKELAGRLGFSALASFSNAFRAATGHTPTAFRKLFHTPTRLS